jgi:hypothetical protein
MNMKKLALVGAIALMGTSAQAVDLNWTYVEAGYSRVDGDEDDIVDAIDLKGSIGFATKWHAQLGLVDGDQDGGEGFDGFDVRIGAHPQIGPNTQFVTEVLYFDYEEDGTFGESNDGIGLSLGLRHALSDQFEVNAMATYVEGNQEFSNSSFDEDFSETMVSLGGRYNWLPNLSTGINVNIDGGGATSLVSFDDTIRFDVRWTFGGNVF